MKKGGVLLKLENWKTPFPRISGFCTFWVSKALQGTMPLCWRSSRSFYSLFNFPVLQFFSYTPPSAKTEIKVRKQEMKCENRNRRNAQSYLLAMGGVNRS